MELNLNDDKMLQEPSGEQIRSGLASLQDEQYAILSRGDEDYVQVYRHGAKEFQLEYRAGSEDKHFGATSEEFTVEQIQDVFAAYAAGGADWQSGWTWEKLDL